ncbi:MAG: ATP-binding protein [Planctomycetota bacterium]
MAEYEKLFARSADLMCDLDSVGRIERGNGPFRSVFGDSGVGEPFASHFDESDREKLEAQLERLSESNPTVLFEGRTSIHDCGRCRSRWTSWQITWLTEFHLAAVGRDVTERYETERKLEAKSSFLRSVIEAEPECVKLVSRDGTLLQMNRAGLHMIAAPSREEAIGLCVYDLMAPEDRKRFVDFNERVCDGEGGDLSFDIIAADDTRRSMETTAVPLLNESGDEILHLAITRDVTERHLLEKQLRHSQRMEAVGQLAGGVAHDFNNLLTAMIVAADLGLEHVGEEHPIAEDLRQIQATGERAGRLTQQLLAFARRQVVRLEPLSVVELASSLEEMLRRALGESYGLHLEVGSECGSIQADRSQMEQVVLNLVLNARDAMGEGGQICISVTNLELSRERAERLGCQPGHHVVLSVADNGPGIADDVLPRIFDPFFTTKPIGMGSGLGLSTCHGIVTQLRGAIDVTSRVDGGTTFEVLIPSDSAVAEVPTSSSGPSVQHGQAETILVVEDEASVRTAIVRMLRGLGYTVVEARDGDDALRCANGLEHISLLLTDMTMPGMSGPTLVDRLRSERGGLPVVYMTGYLAGATTPDGKESVHPILQKPFSRAALAAAVAQTLAASPRQTVHRA